MVLELCAIFLAAPLVDKGAPLVAGAADGLFWRSW
jgi:hypothetical protein